MKSLTKFTTKSGKEIEIWEPSMDRVRVVLEFVNRLVDEDTYLTFTAGDQRTFDQEKLWIQQKIKDKKSHRGDLIWAIFNNKIIGSCDIWRGITPRDQHVGKIGIMVDRDFRRDGIGRFMLDYILKRAKELKLGIIKLDLFSDNIPAYNLYKKYGFKEYGRLPKGLFRKGQYSDEIKMYKELSCFASTFAEATEDEKATRDKQ